MTDNGFKINTLEDLEARKEVLLEEIHKRNETIGKLWSGLFTEKKASTKGELVASIVSKSITAIDAFLLVRKLMKQYGQLFKRKKS